MRHTIVLIALLLLVFCSCRKQDKGTVAAQAAKVYYEYLQHGKFGDYVDGIWQPDSIPESYRSQLEDNARMFMAQMKTEHRGIREVAVSNGVYDEESGTAQAFLYLTFQDGDTEQVLVPMVEVNGIWYLK